MTTPLAGRVRRRLAESGTDPSPAAIAAAVRAEPNVAVLGDMTLRRLTARVRDDLAGAGPLAPLLADPTVTDILVNGDSGVWVDDGTGLHSVDLRIGSADDVRRLAQRLVAACGRRLDDVCPYADARLPDGTRLHAVLPPIAAAGPYLSLRTFRYQAFSLGDMVNAGTMTDPLATLLAAVVAARLAFVVTGGTGSGKSTLLNTMLSLVPHHERIVLVEDAAELRPVHPHVVGLQARTPNIESAGAVNLRDLVRQALRMRPDRLIVGECRGAEVVDMLAALNTGHDGGAGTLHANTPADVPARLEALGLLGGLSREALHAQLAAALRVVVHLRRWGGRRVVDEVGLLVASSSDHRVTCVPVWSRDNGLGEAAGRLRRLLVERGIDPPPILADLSPFEPAPTMASPPTVVSANTTRMPHRVMDAGDHR